MKLARHLCADKTYHSQIHPKQFVNDGFSSSYSEITSDMKNVK